MQNTDTIRDIEYIPVDQAKAGASQPVNYRFQQHGSEGVSAQIVLHGQRSGRPYQIALTVTAGDPAHALEKLMSGIATAKRLYALSPFETINEAEPIEKPARPKPAETERF